MADNLSVASGVAGLLTITIEVSRLAITYVTKVRNATNTVKAILRELKGLKTVLGELDSLLDFVDVKELQSVGASAVLSLPACVEYKIILTDLRLELEKYNSEDPNFTKWTSLLWPLDEGKSKETVGKLHKYLVIFQTALNRDILYVVSYRMAKVCFITLTGFSLGVFSTLKDTKDIRATHQGDQLAHQA
jgi:hypothetical protein